MVFHVHDRDNDSQFYISYFWCPGRKGVSFLQDDFMTEDL